MILVSGAGGKTGRAVVAALARRGERVRAFVRRPLQIEAASELFIGDMQVQSAWMEALDGVRRLYHICPNVHPDEVTIGRMAIAAATRHQIDHFVYHSVLHPQTEKMPHHWRKLQVEAWLFESGLPFTIVQPTAYMQNIRVAAADLYAVPYPVASRLSLVDLNDVAEAVARILSEESHMGATYELVGTPPLSQLEVAAALSARFGRNITAQQIPLAEWQHAARQNGMDRDAIDTLSRMFDYYAQWGLVGNPNVLRWLLQREPTTLAEQLDPKRRS
jgi:uncharacterized protein YbjT (DUF2867 family)